MLNLFLFFYKFYYRLIKITFLKYLNLTNALKVFAKKTNSMIERKKVQKTKFNFTTFIDFSEKYFVSGIRPV